MKRKISFILALLMSASILATGCKKTEETPVADATVSEITLMTTASETEATETETETSVTTSETLDTTSETEETTEATSETTVSETTTVSGSESTSTASAAKEWNETEISEVMYTNQACYSRVKPIVGSDSVDRYLSGTKVNITAATDTGYFKLADGTYIHSDYLTDEAVSADTTAATTKKPSTTASAETEATTSKPTTGGTSVIDTNYTKNYTDRYAYKSLNSSEKQLYKNFVEAIENLNTTVEVPSGMLSDDIFKIYCLVFNEEPQLFWTPRSAPSGYSTLTLSYEFTASEIKSMQKEIDASVKNILATANGYGSTFNKLKVFYDWIIKNHEFLKSGDIGTSGIYNGLTAGGKGLQCSGYAKAMNYLCDLAGIECMTVTGTNPEGASHAWNVVYCDNGYYNLDATWGDPVNDHNSGYIRYNFFLVPDSWISDSHLNVNKVFRSNSTVTLYTAPACTKTSCNYFKAYSKEFSTLDDAKNAMYAELDSAIKEGRNVAEIRVTSADIYEKLLSNSYASDFQKYAKGKGDVSKLSRQKLYNEGVLVVQYDIFYN